MPPFLKFWGYRSSALGIHSYKVRYLKKGIWYEPTGGVIDARELKSLSLQNLSRHLIHGAVVTICLIGRIISFAHISTSLTVTQRVQVPNLYRLWSPNPLRVWILEPESLNIGYFDSLGDRASCRAALFLHLFHGRRGHHM